MAAAIEQHHDENGIIWPRELAPYDVHVVVLPGAEEIGTQAAEALSAAGYDVLLDDRDARAGEKFADADLIGCPIRITAGKKSLEDGKVDVKDRATGEESRLDVADSGQGAVLMARTPPVQRGVLRPDDRDPHGGDRRHLPGARDAGRGSPPAT